jgi:hypothetical protein
MPFASLSVRRKLRKHQREDAGGGNRELSRGADLAEFELRIIAKRQGHTARGRRPAVGGGLRQQDQHEEWTQLHLNTCDRPVDISGRGGSCQRSATPFTSGGTRGVRESTKPLTRFQLANVSATNFRPYVFNNPRVHFPPASRVSMSAFDSHRPLTMTPAIRELFAMFVSGLASSRIRSARLPAATVPTVDCVPK